MTKGNLKNPLTGRARLLAVPSKSHKKAGFGPPGRLGFEDLLPHIARCFIPAPTPEKIPQRQAVRSGILVVPFPGFFAVMNHTGWRNETRPRNFRTRRARVGILPATLPRRRRWLDQFAVE